MKKFGFTMPELIVTIGIVAVTAAVAAPVIGNLMPDKNKLKAIECYNLVNAATEEFLSNEGIYYAPDDWTYYRYDVRGNIVSTLPQPEELPDGYPDCEALMCWGDPQVSPYNNLPGGMAKFSELLFRKYGIEGNVNNNGVGNGVASDGTSWSITAFIELDNNGARVRGYNGGRNQVDFYAYRIDIDVDPSATSPNCMYGAGGCTSPDRFRMYVNHEGNLFAGDPMMEAYLANPLNMNAKKEDRQEAERLAASGKDYVNPRFLYND